MGFVDLQVNGYGGIDFNSDRLTPESMRCACDALRRDGVESILATVITESLDTMCARISRIAQLAKQDKSIGEMIAGVMLGPSLLGAVLPETQAVLFPKATLDMLYVGGQVGVGM